jgi:3,4-dehydroadipyl-CoA semialdehyde dehydrogenase
LNGGSIGFLEGRGRESPHRGCASRPAREIAHGGTRATPGDSAPMETLASYVCGEWREGTGKPATLVNPTTDEPVARSSTEGIDFAAVLAHGRTVGGPALRAMTFAERGAVLKAMSKALHEVRDALIDVSILNAGTTRSDSKFDVDGAIGTLAYYAELGKKLGDRTYLVEGEGEQLSRGPRFFGYHIDTPLTGVAVHVNAFNFPAWGLAEKAAVALLAGVPVVSKPATATAFLTYRVMQRLVETKSVPDGTLQLVCGAPGNLIELLGSQDVLAFTGAGSTGTVLRKLQNVVERSVRVNVEADSLNASVLGSDIEAGSDLYATFVRDVVREMTQKTGQKCTATRRVFVPESMVDRVIADVSEGLGAITVGDPARDDVRMGPLATKQQLADVRAGIDRLASGGAKIVYGDPTKVSLLGGSASGFFISPVLLRADDPRAARVVHEHEVFGPVATVMPHAGVDDAVALVREGAGGLVASVYSDDREFVAGAVLGLAPFHGRVLAVSRKIADQAISPGLALPSCVHGGPGRAGGGEELGGERGMRLYFQRTAVQGDRALLAKVFGIDTP